MEFTKILSFLLVLSIFSLKPTSQQQQQQNFKCVETRSTCQSLVGYKLVNTTNISDIQAFFGVKHFRSLLGANNFPLDTLPSHTVKSQQVIRIPVPCICFNKTGVSYKMPIYTVREGDFLYYIATTMFGRLVTHPQITEANKLENANVIEIGQKLWIPLPCSCDSVGGEDVVHYAHVVEEGSTMEEIAAEFGTDSGTLFGLNGIVDDSELIAGNTIDVPLKACNSSVTSNSLDFPLLVANGTYVFTANNCIKCTCNSANNWTLQCEPSGLKSSCPLAQCAGSDLYIGNSTTSGCNRTTCAYAGHSSNQTIFTTLITDNTCATGSPAGSGSFSLTAYSSWSVVLMFIHLILLGLYLH